VTAAGAEGDSLRRLRQACALVAVATALLAGYVSLVPFDFVRPTPGWQQEFLKTLEGGIQSRGNFAANILLFVPIGLGGLGALIGRKRSATASLIGGLVVLILGTAWSVGIETAQGFVAGRTPTLIDVVAQIIGTAAGATFWLLFSREFSRISERWISGDRFGLLAGALGIYTAIRVLVLLLPLDVSVDFGDLWHHLRDGGVVINPLKSSVFRPENLPSSLLLMLLAVPVGWFCLLAGVPRGKRRSSAAAIGFAVVIFGLAEVAQGFILSTRADSGQLLVSIFGAAIGIVIGRRAFPQAAAESGPADSALVPVLSVICACAVFVIYNWSPFDFDFSRHVAAERFDRLFRVPFAGYYENPEFKALAEIATKLAVSAPIGFTLRWWLGHRAGSVYRLMLVVVAAAAVTLVAGVEIGQALLPSRYPDNTDFLLGVTGIALGWWAPWLLRPSMSRGRANDLLDSR
jgi:glycopeptide antibiotics resistance protein